MPELPGQQPYKAPTIREIPSGNMDLEALTQAVSDGIRPGETRYARTGPTHVPDSVTIEGADLIVSMELGAANGTRQRELHLMFLSRFPADLSIELLEGLIQQIRDVQGHRSSRN